LSKTKTKSATIICFEDTYLPKERKTKCDQLKHLLDQVNLLLPRRYIMKGREEERRGEKINTFIQTHQKIYPPS
jgi:hypothetical protein